MLPSATLHPLQSHSAVGKGVGFHAQAMQHGNEEIGEGHILLLGFLSPRFLVAGFPSASVGFGTGMIEVLPVGYTQASPPR